MITVMDITVTVRDSDVGLLDEIAEREWRAPHQQASAFLEQALATARARKEREPRAVAGRRGRTNGVAVAV